MYLKLPSLLSLALTTTTILAGSNDPYDPDTYGFDYTPPTNEDIDIGLWLELGRGIGDEDLNDLAGYSVASSAEGNIVAVGSPLHSTIDGKRAGRVRVYEYNEFNNAWSRIGTDLAGSPGDEAGTSVSVSVSGDYVAVGAPKCTREVKNVMKNEIGCVTVYERTYESAMSTSQYEQVGNELTGIEPFDHFGTAVDVHAIYELNEDENYEELQVAIGAPGAKNSQFEEVGKAYFLQYIFNGDITRDFESHVEVASGIDSSKFGSSVSLSIDDDMLIVGAPEYNSQGKSKAGKVFLYSRKLDQSTWTEVTFAGELVGDEQNERCGTSVSITLRGNYLAYGCPSAGSNGNYKKGYSIVKSLSYDSTAAVKWSVVTVDDKIWGEKAGDESGTAVDIGDDGYQQKGASENLYLAVGAPNNYPRIDMQKAGHVRVHHLENNKWETTKLDIDGRYSFDEFGSSVAISYDGHRVIAGAPGGIGYAKIYDLKYTEAPSIAPSPPPTNSPTLFPTADKRKPSRPSTGNKPVGGSNNGDDEVNEGGSPIFLMLFVLAVIPALLYLIFKVVVYWRSRRSYASRLGEDVQIVDGSNDLELSRSVNTNQDTAQQETRDII